MDPMRIVLVDDHVLIRKGLAALLAGRERFCVVGEASNGCEALDVARQTMPDLILMDVQMPGWSGPETTRLIKREMPHVKIVMLTVSDDENDLLEAIKSGAQGYLLKNLEPDQLFELLERTQEGEAALSRSMMALILEEFQHSNEPEAGQEKLSERELAVLRLVVEGATNAEIGEALTITEHTVKVHLRNILDKLHLQNRVQAAVYAVREGLASRD